MSKKLLSIAIAAWMIFWPTPPQKSNPAITDVTGYFDWQHSPDIPPASPNAMDDEFNGAAISGTWASLGSPTNVVANGFLDMTIAGAGAADNITGIEQTLPAAPYAFVAKFECTFVLENFHTCGIALRESGTGKIVVFGPQAGSAPSSTVVLAAYTNPTTFSATVATLPTSLFNSGYIKISRTSTTLTWFYSTSGTGWMQVWSESITTHFTTAPDRILIFGNAHSTNPTDTVVWFFRRTT